jgi:hypothetical protein
MGGALQVSSEDGQRIIAAPGQGRSGARIAAVRRHPIGQVDSAPCRPLKFPVFSVV